jgi:hypothetical protein
MNSDVADEAAAALKVAGEAAEEAEDAAECCPRCMCGVPRADGEGGVAVRCVRSPPQPSIFNTVFNFAAARCAVAGGGGC